MARQDTHLTQTGEEVQEILNAVADKADKVASPIAGHLASLDANGNLADSGLEVDDVYEKPSSGIPASDLADGVVPKTLHITSWTPTYASGGNDINLGTRTQAAATLGITVTQLDAMMGREYDSVILSGTEDQVLSASAFSEDAVLYTANAVSSWYGLQFYIDETEYHCLALQEELPTVPEISTNINTDGNSNTKTASPKAVKTYADTKYTKPASGIPASDLADGVIPDISGKADAATTLAGYGITDAYTKTEIDSKVASTYKPAGSVANVGSLGSLTAANLGKVYNFTSSFTTTSDFVEGSGKTYPVGTNVAIVNTGTTSSPVYKYDVLAGFVDISGKADKSEMSVVDGTDANADKTTITLKSGTSATVLKSHQDISGKADKVSGATSGHLAALDGNGNLTDSGKSASDLSVEANPTVPSGTTPETMETIKIGSQYYELGGGTIDAEDYSGVAPVIVNPSNYYTKSETEALVETPVASTQPSGGFLPNVIYDLGEITGSVTFALAAPTDNTIANTYVWTFETGSTAPTIVWPSNLTWLGGNAPTINTGKHYEITIRKGYANCLEF